MTANEQTRFKRQLALVILGTTMPFILTLATVQVSDHYKVKDLREHTIRADDYYQAWSELQLDMERRNSLLERIALGNQENIESLRQEYLRLCDKLDRYVEQMYRTRGGPDVSFKPDNK